MNIGLIEKVGGAIIAGFGIAVFGKGIKKDREQAHKQVYRKGILDTVDRLIEEAEKNGGTRTWEDDDGIFVTTYTRKEKVTDND